MAASYATNPAAAPAPATRTKALSALAAVAGALLLGAVALLTRKPAGAWASALAAETKPAFQDATTGTEVLTALLGFHREFGVGTKKKSSRRSWPFKCMHAAPKLAKFPQLAVDTSGMLCKQQDSTVTEALLYPTTMIAAKAKEASGGRHGRCCAGATEGEYVCVNQNKRKGKQFPGCPLAEVDELYTRITTAKKVSGDPIGEFVIGGGGGGGEVKEHVKVTLTSQTVTGQIMTLSLPPSLSAFESNKAASKGLAFRDPAGSASKLKQLGAMVGNMVESGKFAGAKLCGHGFTNLEDSTAAEELVEGRAMTMLEALLAGITLENGKPGAHFTAGITLGMEAQAHFTANAPTADSTPCGSDKKGTGCLIAGGITVLLGDEANKPCKAEHYVSPETFCGDDVKDGCPVPEA